MSLGFHITGRMNRPDALVEKAQALAKESGYGIGTGEGGMCIRLCPMGDLEVVWSEDAERPGQWQVEADCQTTPAGPGFHKAALELAERLEIGEIEVDDETDYVNHRDFNRMCGEHFYPWLRMLVQICRKTFSEKDDSQICLCWDTNLYQPENIGRTAVTPLGRYSLEAMEGILEEGGIEALAERFFCGRMRNRMRCFIGTGHCMHCGYSAILCLHPAVGMTGESMKTFWKIWREHIGWSRDCLFLIKCIGKYVCWMTGYRA